MELANQFPKIGVLKCNYRFTWIENDGVYRHKRKVWGVNASQNSYTSGVWRDRITATYDDQDKFYLSWTPITAELEHDTRIIISMLKKKPWVYRITKVDDTATRGIITFTIKQDKFEPEHDYVCMDPDSEDYGEMYADYYASDVLPVEPDEKDILVVESANSNVRLGASKVLTAKVYDSEKNDITEMYKNSECIWTFKLVQVKTKNDLIIIEKTWLEEYEENNKQKYRFKCKFKFNGDEQYLGHNIEANCTIDNLSENVSLDIVPL